jgi:hypothetical protein
MPVAIVTLTTPSLGALKIMRMSTPSLTNQMDSYDGTKDPDEHIERIEVVLTYRSVRGAIKCKLFVTILR